jgi:hypothetical protein
VPIIRGSGFAVVDMFRFRLNVIRIFEGSGDAAFVLLNLNRISEAGIRSGFGRFRVRTRSARVVCKMVESLFRRRRRRL